MLKLQRHSLYVGIFCILTACNGGSFANSTDTGDGLQAGSGGSPGSVDVDGPSGASGVTQAPFIWQGAWLAGTSYASYDFVAFNDQLILQIFRSAPRIATLATKSSAQFQQPQVIPTNMSGSLLLR